MDSLTVGAPTMHDTPERLDSDLAAAICAVAGGNDNTFRVGDVAQEFRLRSQAWVRVRLAAAAMNGRPLPGIIVTATDVPYIYTVTAPGGWPGGPIPVPSP